MKLLLDIAPPTAKQKKVLDFIEGFTHKWGSPPTYADIQKHFGFKAVGTVQDYIVALEKKGHLQRQAGRWNSLQVLPQQKNLDLKNSQSSFKSESTIYESKESWSVPLLGKVAAGRPLESYKHNEFLTIPPQMHKGSEDLLALQIAGDSMIEEGILDGDFIIAKKSATAINGQIVVAFVEDGATIKTFYRKSKWIELHSANPKYQPIIVKDHHDFRIEGLYCGLIRLAH
ncbi:MAG: transcriptional repressor LexA [Pseudobdellovibrionaceae bacterium]